MFVIFFEGVVDCFCDVFCFYDWDVVCKEVCWMCGFDIEELDVDVFVVVLVLFICDVLV